MTHRHTLPQAHTHRSISHTHSHMQAALMHTYIYRFTCTQGHKHNTLLLTRTLSPHTCAHSYRTHKLSNTHTHSHCPLRWMDSCLETQVPPQLQHLCFPTWTPDSGSAPGMSLSLTLLSLSHPIPGIFECLAGWVHRERRVKGWGGGGRGLGHTLVPPLPAHYPP